MNSYQPAVEALRQLLEAISDPLYDPLREALREPSTFGYVTRNVEGCTSAMVAGLIVGCLMPKLWLVLFSEHISLRREWFLSVFDDPDPAAFALDYVTEAIERRAKEADHAAP